eukprot:COSAG02_NODE_953_length_15689_cov_112.180564_2_plen_149_part_00
MSKGAPEEKKRATEADFSNSRGIETLESWTQEKKLARKAVAFDARAARTWGPWRERALCSQELLGLRRAYPSHVAQGERIVLGAPRSARFHMAHRVCTSSSLLKLKMPRIASLSNRRGCERGDDQFGKFRRWANTCMYHYLDFDYQFP